MFSWDVLYRAISCDCLSEDGSVLIVAKGLTDQTDVDADATDCNHFISDIHYLNIPDPPKSWNDECFEAHINFNSRTTELGSATNQEFPTIILNPRIACTKVECYG